MKSEERHRAAELISDAVEMSTHEDSDFAIGRRALAHLTIEFYVIPRRVMQNNPPSLLRERAHYADRDGLTWLAAWFREIADATED